MRFLLSGSSLQKSSLLLSRRMASYLINDSKYSFLKELGLQETNAGVFHGKWAANGATVDSVSPASGKPIAKVWFGLYLKCQYLVCRSNTAQPRTGM